MLPIRVLLTGKLHGPDMASSVLLIYKAGSSDVLVPQYRFVSLDQRIEMIRGVDWNSFSEDRPILDPAVSVSH